MLHLINGNVCVFIYSSTGQSFRFLAFSFRMDRYIVGKTADQIRDVLWSKLLSKYFNSFGPWQVLFTVVKFLERWNFPNVIGCTDGKHIPSKCFTKAGSLFYNYKHCFVVLQCVADSESRFILHTKVLLVSKVYWWYIFWFYFILLLGRLWIYFTKSCKVWGKWNRNAFLHPSGWGLSSKDVPNEAFREKGYVIWRTCFELQAVASREIRWVCVWYPNSKMAIVKQQ